MTKPIPSILADLAEEAPDAMAITCDGDTITRGELHRRSSRLARAFEAQGLQQGQIAAITLQNSIDLYVICFAIWKLGAIPLPMSWRLPGPERDQILELAQPGLVIGTAEPWRDVPHWPADRQPDPDLSDEELDVRISPNWKVQTTGGSTGRPKLIIAGMSGDFDVDWAVTSFGIQPGGVQLVAGPLYHTAAFSMSMFGLFAGQRLVVLPRFDEEAALEKIGEHQVEFMIVVPTMMSRMAKLIDASPERFELGSLGRVWHTGAPCPPWLKRRWIDLVGGDTLYEVYGGTEQQAFCVISGSVWLEHPGSVGPVVFGEMKVVDENGDEVPTGTIGEIYLKTPDDVPKTYEYIGAEARTLPGGWETLGELGHIDEDGYVHLADRRVDLILVGGANVYPAEVEGALLEHPNVTSCAVVGLPDDDLGQRVHAVIQRSLEVTEEELVAHLADRIEPHKLPRSMRFVAESLRDDAGKLRRSAIREQEIELLQQSIG